jgi:hypothetical protein
MVLNPPAGYRGNLAGGVGLLPTAHLSGKRFNSAVSLVQERCAELGAVLGGDHEAMAAL